MSFAYIIRFIKDNSVSPLSVLGNEMSKLRLGDVPTKNSVGVSL